MPNPKLVAVVTAFMLVASALRAQDPFALATLQELERLVLAKDTAALARFLASNPQLVRGEDPLARELRGFMSCVSAGRLECFASPVTVGTIADEADAPPPPPLAIY